MVVESLSAELERLYELEELKKLSATLLGLDPDALGGASAKGSFARALANRCAELDAVDALVDVVLASRRTLSSELVAKLRNGALDQAERPREGDEVGEVLVLKELGSSPTGSVYRAHRGGQEVRLRRLSRDLRERRREAQRFYAAARLAGTAAHPGLPLLVTAGTLDAEGRLAGVAHEYVEGVPLSETIAEGGGRHLSELLPLLWAILEALSALHRAGVTHGALHAGNVLVSGSSPQSPHVTLLDAGAYHLRPALVGLGRTGRQNWLVTAPPELLRGEPLGTQSDVYSFGALVYQLLSGRGPFADEHALDLALGHLIEEAESLTFTAAGNGASPEVDAFVRLLLDKDPKRRPRDADEAVEGLRRLWRASQRPPASLTDEQVDERFQKLIDDAGDDRRAAELEALVDLGVEPLKLADGFYTVAREVRTKNAPESERVVRKLLARAARLYETGGNHEQAEKLYHGLVKLDPEDGPVVEAFDRLRKKLGKFDELIESLIERTDGAKTSQQKGAYFAEIGRVYHAELKDDEQALVAYAQAFCEDPLNERYVEQLERLAGARFPAWEDVLGHCVDAVENDELPAEARAALSYRMGRWYADKVARPDLALPAFTRAIELEPAHDRALSELCQLYRRAQQWQELAQTLLRRADVAAPNVARDLRAEAAEILASHLGNPQAAQDLYQGVLAEDPAHGAAAEGFGKLLRQSGDAWRALKILEGRANALSGDERHGVLLEVAEGYELELDKLVDAERLYRAILTENSKHLDALRGLDRILTRGGRYGDLLDVLRAQLDLAVTARQKVSLLERIAAVYDEEYLDHALAAEALEAVLDLDPQRSSAAQALARHYRSLERWNDLAQLYESQLKLTTADDQKVELGMQLGRVLAEHLKQSTRAIAAYEGVLEVMSSHPGALDALATLRAAAGDSEHAVSALDALAERAPTPEARAEQYLRAAAMLEARGEVAGALTRYKFAADANPNSPSITRKVRQKYRELGNYGAAVHLIEEELERTEGAAQRAKLAGEMALIFQRHLHDD
ncbi:MAG TPA: protein kinase, partial [Polyangiaceae bacterium]